MREPALHPFLQPLIHLRTPHLLAVWLAQNHGRGACSNRTAVQLLGDDDALEAHQLSVQADMGSRLEALGKISKPVHALTFLNNVEYKAVWLAAIVRIFILFLTLAARALQMDRRKP